MKVKDLVAEAKTKGAYTARRAQAVTAHGKDVVTTGVDAAKTVAGAAVRSIKSAVATQRETLTDSSLPLRARVRKVGSNAASAWSEAKAEVGSAARDGYDNVSGKLSRVTGVTRFEQAEENRIARKAKKAKHAAERATES